MNDKHISPLVLINEYVLGKINSEDADLLLAETERNPVVADLLYKNLLADLWLESLYQDQCTLAETEKSAGISEDLMRRFFDLSNENDQLADRSKEEPSLDDLIALQNTLEPIRHDEERILSDPLSRKVYLFAKKCFWPDKTQWEESIAPIVTLISLILLAVVSLIGLSEYFLIERSEECDPIAAVQIREMIDPVWEEGSTIYKRGQFLDTGRFELKSGTIHLKSNHGANLIVEGPANFTVNGPMDLFCLNGKISGTISKEAIGYTISTPLGSITDRGTEFFIEVSKEKINVDVIQGKVDYLSPTREIRNLVAGSSLHFDLSQKIGKLVPASPVNLKNFIDLPEFRYRARKKAEIVLEEKRKRDLELDQDPNLLARFDFSNSEDSFVPNTSLRGTAIYPRLRLYDQESTEGSLADTHAILFKRSGSRGELDVLRKNVSWSGLFLSAHVRIDQLKNKSMIFFTAGNYPSDPNSFCWQLAPNGELGIYFGGEIHNPKSYYKPSVINEKDLGTWIKIGVKIDSKMKKISHYLNDELIRTNDWPNPVSLCLDKANIGNLESGKRKTLKTGLYGAMEEFQISTF